MGITVDASGNLYVADTNNFTIRKITPAGGVTTLAGSAGVDGSTDGTGLNASFSYPTGITVDSSGNLFVTEDSAGGKPVRKITPAGVVTTPVNTGGCDPFAAQGIAVDAGDNLYVVSDSGFVICKITSAGAGACSRGVIRRWQHGRNRLPPNSTILPGSRWTRAEISMSPTPVTTPFAR